jgi:hypothetical protein
MANEGCMAHISFGAHCTHAATAPSCPGLHPPPAKLHAADIWFCGLYLLCVMLTLYSPVPSAVQCQLSVGCDAGKRAGHAGCQRQQAQAAYHAAGILSCGHALAGPLSTSCAMQQPIISRTPLELQAGVWHAHGMCPLQRQYSAPSASPTLIPLAWACAWLLLLPAHPHTARVV